jgi:hypothetical protein
MRHKDFPAKWIQGIHNSGTSSILLNGTLGKVFHCKCDVTILKKDN